jgi:O-methyltransferase
VLTAIETTVRALMLGDSLAPLLRTVKPYTLCGNRRLRTLAQLARQINDHGIAGDIVECGTCNGGSAALLATFLGERRHLWLYDSFQGMPGTVAKDGEEARQYEGACVGQVERVKEVLGKVGTRPDQYTIRKGWFQDTFRQELPERVALLHCDADFYDSVLLTLETFYPRIPAGGCVVLDDFGYWEGSREAFYDFCARHGERPLLERVTSSQAYWTKGKQHNRKGPTCQDHARSAAR